MIQPSLFCLVCGDPDATVTSKAMNGLPRDVAICAGCTEAIQRRQVGISRLANGELSVTDGRKVAAA